MTTDSGNLNVWPVGNLNRYLQDIRKYPMLSADEEQALARRWSRRGDIKAAHKLITSHLRLVAKIALGYRSYGMGLEELISEGNVGMMQAVSRFDPDRGFRLSTYAIWWIRAAIQEYVLHSWSLVKMGTTPAQKKLFFSLRRIKRELAINDQGDLGPENVAVIADRLKVPMGEVVSMDWRMRRGDVSLNETVDGTESEEWIDRVEDEGLDQEELLGAHEERLRQRALLGEAMKGLTKRERAILKCRRLNETRTTLEVLSRQYGITCEGVRQIELRAMSKIKKAVRRLAKVAPAAAQAALEACAQTPPAQRTA